MNTIRLEQMSDPERWYSTQRNGDIRLMDPVSGGPLRTDLPPVLIDSDPEFSAGVAFLRSRANSVKFNDLYHVHELDTDLGDLSKTTFQGFIKEADYHGAELPGLSAADLSEMIVASRSLFNITIFGGYPAFRRAYHQGASHDTGMLGFQSRFFYTLTQTAAHTPTFNMDLRPDNTQLEEDMLAVKALWTKDTSEFARFSFALMRDWCMIGSIGLELLRREIGKPERPLKVVTNAGLGHIGKSRKARTLGLEVTARYLQPERTKMAQPIADISAKVARTGIVSPAEVRLVSKGL